MLRGRPIFISFALIACIVSTAPACATPVAQPSVLDTRIELASGGLQRCWIVQTPWGPQRRCRSYGGYYGGWRTYYGGYGAGWYGYPARGGWDRDDD